MNTRHTSPLGMSTWKWFTGAALVAALVACKHEPPIAPEDEGTPGDPVPVDTTDEEVVCDPDTVYFVQDILPLMISSCAGPDCHDAVDPEENVELYDYNHIRQHVTPFQPNESFIFTDGIWETGNDQMPPDNPLDPALQDMIITWIEQGALNNSCEASACDTTNVTYSGTIQPILQAKCNGCHNPNNMQGNVLTNTWAGANAIALDGRMASTIQHLNGVPAMPPTGPMLSACKIEQILIWIGDNAPNN